MNSSDLKCRNCNTTLNLDVGGTVGVCPKCGNRYSIKSNGAVYYVNSFIGRSSTYKDPLSYTQPNDVYSQQDSTYTQQDNTYTTQSNTYTQQNNTYTKDKTKPKNNNFSRPVRSFSSLKKALICGIAFFSVSTITFALMLTKDLKKIESIIHQSPQPEITSESKKPTSANTDLVQAEEVKPPCPKTEVISNAVELIFNAKADEITAEQFESIKYLSVNSNIIDKTVTVDYSFEDFFDYENNEDFKETVLTVSMPLDSLSSKTYAEDLHFFKGLTYLEASPIYLKEGCLSDLINIKALCINYANKPAKILPYINPKQILYLQLNGFDSFEGIENFTSLETLYLNGAKLTDISPLLNCQKLRNLNIVSYKSITNYYILEQMPQLENLTICDNKSIKDISFISALTNLKSLTLKETLIKDITPVEKLSNLKSLNLISNYMLLNVDSIAALTQLENLTIDFEYVQDFSSVKFDKLSALTNLKSLNINYAYDAEFVQYLTNLEVLTLDYCNCYKISQYLKNLKNLKSLTLRHMISESHDAFESLSQLKNLTEIDLSYNHFDRDISGIFKITQLEKINLYSSSFWITPEQIPVYPNLKVLNMAYWYLADFMYTGGDGMVKKEYHYNPDNTSVVAAFAKSPAIEELYLNRVDINSIDYIANLHELKVLDLSNTNLNGIDDNLFANVTKIQNLYLKENSVSSLEFAKPLAELENLNISNNYVTDLTPLMELQNLKNVWASGNPVKYWDVLKNVNVIH